MKLELTPITLREANDFVENHHRHSGRTNRDGGKFAIACGSEDGGLAGVAIVGNPVSATLMDGWTAEVTRVCVSPEAPKNAPSMLYGAAWRAWRAMGGRRLVTYTLQTESGASLRGAGWKIVAEVKGGGLEQTEHRPYPAMATNLRAAKVSMGGRMTFDHTGTMTTNEHAGSVYPECPARRRDLRDEHPRGALLSCLRQRDTRRGGSQRGRGSHMDSPQSAVFSHGFSQTKKTMKLSGGMAASMFMRQSPRMDVGGRFGITLTEARRNLFR